MPFRRGWVYVVSSQQSELTIKPHRHEDLNSDLQHPHKSQTLQNPFVTPGLVCGSDNQTYPCKSQFLYPLVASHIPSIPMSELKKKHHCNCVELCVILFGASFCPLIVSVLGFCDGLLSLSTHFVTRMFAKPESWGTVLSPLLFAVIQAGDISLPRRDNILEGIL